MNTSDNNEWKQLDAELQAVCGSGNASSQLPSECQLVPDGWLKGRIVFWPKGVPDTRRISLVSSRLPQRRDLCSWWYDILRTTCARCHPDQEMLLAIPGTTCFDSVIRASELFGIARAEVRLPDDETKPLNSASAISWLQSVLNEEAAVTEDHPLVNTVLVSASVLPTDEKKTDSQIPIRDICSFGLADRIVILHHRPSGNVANLIAAHVKQERPAIVMVAQTDHQKARQPDDAARGTVSWLLFHDQDDERLSQDARMTPSARRPIPKGLPCDLAIEEAAPEEIAIEKGPIACPQDWLSHWTRPFRSEWPDQSPDEYLDELILGCSSADRSALAALLRMIQQRRIISSVARRGEGPTVSWTAVPLSEFRSRHIFRAHRHRYDFEPYGIAVKKSALNELLAEPVQYDSSVRQTEERFGRYFQPRYDRTGKIDWSREQEWRLPGDLNLADLDPSSVVAFCNDKSEQTQIQHLCDWPVHVVPPEEK